MVGAIGSSILLTVCVTFVVDCSLTVLLFVFNLACLVVYYCVIVRSLFECDVVVCYVDLLYYFRMLHELFAYGLELLLLFVFCMFMLFAWVLLILC